MTHIMMFSRNVNDNAVFFPYLTEEHHNAHTLETSS